MTKKTGLAVVPLVLMMVGILVAIAPSADAEYPVCCNDSGDCGGDQLCVPGECSPDHAGFCQEL